jgi:queuine tRNA-ribosyltransferase accessory subunit
MADVITSQGASVKRVEKSADRTHAWLRDASGGFLSGQHSSDATGVFAAIPPVENVQQSLYLQDLAEEYRMLLSGLAIYSPTTAAELPRALCDLPRICLSDPDSPHAVLNDIALGVDLVTTSFVTSSSNCGIALTFDFPGPNSENEAPRPLGYDLWKPGQESSLQPLSPDCDCFTCTSHHKAYVHHLLQAKEMLAWTLLQLHNHAIIDRFFATARKSIARGTFEEDVRTFNRNYEAALPESMGLGPRTRGYQTKSVGGGEAKKNEKSWGRLDDAAQKLAEAESGIATPEGDSEQLEVQGFADKI